MDTWRCGLDTSVCVRAAAYMRMYVYIYLPPPPPRTTTHPLTTTHPVTHTHANRRDFYLSAEESVEYGMVDHVIMPGHKDPLSVPMREVGFGKFASGDDQKYQPAFTPSSWS